MKIISYDGNIRLPKIKLKCDCGHKFETLAHAGLIICPSCNNRDSFVSLWKVFVKKNPKYSRDE